MSVRPITEPEYLTLSRRFAAANRGRNRLLLVLGYAPATPCCSFGMGKWSLKRWKVQMTELVFLV